MRRLVLLALLLAGCSGWDDDEAFVPHTRWVYLQDSLGLHRFDPRQPESPAEALGSCTAFDLNGDELWLLRDGQLLRLDARSGQVQHSRTVDTAAHLICAGDRLLLIATTRRIDLRDRQRPDRLLATLEVDAPATAALATGGQIAVGLAGGRLLLLDERARVPRADLTLPARPLSLSTDRNYRLRVQLADPAGGWREAIVDVGGGAVIGLAEAADLRHRYYSPLSRSLYEREWLAEVDWRRDSLLTRWPAVGPVAALGVDFFSGIAWLWRGGQLLPLDLHRSQTGTPRDWPARPAAMRFYIHVPSGRR